MGSNPHFLYTYIPNAFIVKFPLTSILGETQNGLGCIDSSTVYQGIGDIKDRLQALHSLGIQGITSGECDCIAFGNAQLFIYGNGTDNHVVARLYRNGQWSEKINIL